MKSTVISEFAGRAVTPEYENYLALRYDWSALLNDRDQPMRSVQKDDLYDRLTRAWNRLTKKEKSDAAFHCRVALS